MSEIKDPAIKLFGRTIPLPESQIPVEDVEKHVDVAMTNDKDVCLETMKGEVQNPSPCVSEEPGLDELDTACGLNNLQDRQDPPTNGDKTVAVTNPEEDPAKTETVSEEKVLKKPDKILPCPRCNSLDTKFCYYNNYNVNQPRHFCKNCQRYWTAGGTMRNVPVGAGRRKNKHSPSHFRHIIISSDGMPIPGVDTPDTARHQVLSAPTSHKGNGGVIKFGSDTPLCESIASVLSLTDQKQEIEVGSLACGESGEEHSCGSSVTAFTCRENKLSEKNVGQIEQDRLLTGCHNGIAPPPQMQCYPGPPWPYPWNMQWNNVGAMMAAPAFCAPSIPFPFVPPSYWGCLPSWAAGPWNVSWSGSNNGLSPPSSSTSNSACSGNDSPTLGKHSRDATLPGEEKAQKCLWVPKTLRIDDWDEAAKSSIWATLGIKNDQNEPITKGGMFKAFQPKMEDKSHTLDATQVLHANPAALSRSQTFQESTT